MSEDAGPLAGLRIVDVTSVFLGPFATQILGDLGAEVIKVEPLEGELTRAATPLRNPGMGAVFMGLNRNKRSLSLDLKSAQGREILLRLCGTADMFLHNMRAAAIERLGLGYEAVRAVRPDIVYCLACGFSEAGPYAGRPAYDDVIQAASGMVALQGRSTGEPAYIATAMADKVAGLTVVYALLAAILHRNRTGRGQFIEVPMFETNVAFLAVEHLSGASFDPPIGGAGYQRLLTPHRRPHRTTDGMIGVIPYTDRHWQALFLLAGQPELVADARFASIEARSRHFPALYAWLAETMATRSTAEWLDLLARAEIPATPVLSPDDWLTDPHLRQVGLFETRHHPTEGEIRVVRNPVTFSDSPASLRRPTPVCGQDSEAVLRELGYTAQEITVLVENKIVRKGDVEGCPDVSHRPLDQGRPRDA